MITGKATIEFVAIGVIKTPFETREGVPIQFIHSNHEGEVFLLPEYFDGLKDLDGFSHAYLFYYFDRHDGYDLVTKPYLDDTPRGIFATRAPRRPNGLGMSIVQILGVDRSSGTVRFRGADMLNGTPLIDIKPYVAEFDTISSTRHGWCDEVSSEKSRISDDRF